MGKRFERNTLLQISLLKSEFLSQSLATTSNITRKQKCASPFSHFVLTIAKMLSGQNLIEKQISLYRDEPYKFYCSLINFELCSFVVLDSFFLM